MEIRKYFTHINALRGLAILLVFLYHLREQWCPQGFLGVDAFFVISGYFLVPPLLCRSYKEGEFSWWGYFKGKATRILPPLVVMVLMVLIIGVPLMIASDLFGAASTARTVITGFSNVYLGLLSTDYFAPGVKENVFLHTWYIAVLIQVVVIAPFLCRPLSRLRALWSYLLLGLIGTISFLIFFQHWLPRECQDSLPNMFKDGGKLGSVYYMTAGRLWEIIAGAFIAFLPISRGRTSRSLLLSLGVLLLIAPCFWPQNASGLALFAVIGTALIIRYGESTHFSRLLENRAFMWLGTFSFSLYLIHWPVMALSRYALMRDFRLLDCAWVTVLSLSLSWALYHFVEKRRPHLLSLIIIWVSTMGFALVLRKTDGLKNYVHVEVNAKTYPHSNYKDWEFAPTTSWFSHYPSELNPEKGFHGDSVLDEASPNYGRAAILQIGDKSKLANFVLLGDSYANALFSGFDVVAKQEGWSGLYLNLYMTPFWNRINLENPNAGSRFTRRKAEALLNWLKANPHLHFIIIHQRWHWHFIPAETWDGEPIVEEKVWDTGEKSLVNFCERVRSMGREIIFIMPTPEANVPKDTPLQLMINRAQLWYHPAGMKPHVCSNLEEYYQQNSKIREILTRIHNEHLCKIIDPAQALFSNGIFDPIEGDELIVFDRGHLTPYGSKKLMEALRVQIRNILVPPSQGNGSGSKTVPAVSGNTD